MIIIVTTHIGTQIFLFIRIRNFMKGSSLRKYKESNDTMNARVTIKDAWYCDLTDEKYNLTFVMFFIKHQYFYDYSSKFII